MTFEGMRASTCAPALVVVSALTLAGCSSRTDSVGEQMAEELIESGTEGDVDIDVDDGFTATWRMESPEVGLVETYITEWENAGFTQGGFLDMSTDGTRVWTYQMTSQALEVAVSATIADGDETEDNLVSISGTYLD